MLTAAARLLLCRNDSSCSVPGHLVGLHFSLFNLRARVYMNITYALYSNAFWIQSPVS